MGNWGSALGESNTKTPPVPFSLGGCVGDLDTVLGRLAKCIEHARQLADNLHGGEPRAAGIASDKAERGSLLGRIQDRVSTFDGMLAALDNELTRIGNAI